MAFERLYAFSFVTLLSGFFLLLAGLNFRYLYRVKYDGANGKWHKKAISRYRFIWRVTSLLAITCFISGGALFIIALNQPSAVIKAARDNDNTVTIDNNKEVVQENSAGILSENVIFDDILKKMEADYIRGILESPERGQSSEPHIHFELSPRPPIKIDPIYK